ncbi:glyoxylate/hydroxypyruvate reductase A [Paracoccus sp. R12_1]|uniref:2-hydroxyacid dehydrogenase n=1 Tax=unclassified Paracoccus (in: a-proteobacteria) TaxID=2688777 RepID=UPI001ADD56F3|nr:MULTISPECIES: glyoxylate/hydroxypyruvate reductase A [unclassified Paracoccus (in: a-proteobacteria)]MBO9453628.1 glyoxylate/hydroxypyruvate reductase A [Paracoccus sp. R12_2]MBO9486948.1 glyoxylate/hydroxypyruvate reductase A [Paracoccus sp. R12_1]
MKVLFAAPDKMWSDWAPALRSACPEMDLARDGAPAGFDAIIYAPGGEIDDLSPFSNARLVQSLWAGVERIVTNPTLTQPLARMVDPGLAQGMAEFCTGWVMRAHLGMDRYLQDGNWRNGQIPPLARERDVVILGMGELGRAVAAMLRPIGFRLTGFSASGRPVDGVEVLPGDHLDQALQRADILVTLLPETPDTRGLMNAARLVHLPKGAWLINPGRGTLIDDDALLAALDRGQLGHAVLDVFRDEPLPPSHPFWGHAGVTVTPHIAAETRPQTAAPVVAENLRRAMSGAPILHLVDRNKGY